MKATEKSIKALVKDKTPALKLMSMVLTFFTLLGLSQAAMAAALDVPFVTDFACSVVAYLRGPVAVIIFVLVVVVTLVFGMLMRVKWETIITVCIVFGVVMGIGSILGSNSTIAGMAGLGSCFQ